LVIEDFPLNVELFQLINRAHHPILDRFFLLFSLLGSGYVLIPIFLLVYFLRREKLKPLALAIIIETLTVLTLKTFFPQPRPASLLEDVHLLVPLYWRSFPSGDTAMAFAVATVLSKGERPLVKFILFTYALLIGYGRVYLGVHFPLDVATGALIGVLSGILSLKITERRRRR